MLSGRYRTEVLASNWSKNTSGFCLTSSCEDTPETLEHILLWCPSYQKVRDKLKNLWLKCHHPLISELVESILGGPPEELVQFLLDASVHHKVIGFGQKIGDEALKTIFHLTRSWCFTIHKERSKILGRWPWSLGFVWSLLFPLLRY